MNESIMLHIPHSSQSIPADYVRYFSAAHETVRKNLIAVTDFATDLLFNHPSYPNRLVFPISRLLCDVERFRNDADEIMASKGMGVVYTHGAFGESLRPYNYDLRSHILDFYYDPHHRALLAATQDIMRKNGLCVIVDAHSFPSAPLPYELNQAKHRPDFCIGTDDIHTPKSLSNTICKSIQAMGYSIAVNCPFVGTIVPLPLLGQAGPVFSVMIEVNRKLYMDEAKQKLISEFTKTKFAIAVILYSISQWAEQAQRFMNLGPSI